MKKIILRILIALVVLMILAVLAVGLFLDKAIKRGVETFGPKLAKVEIQTREAEEKSRNVRCPVCGSKTKRIQNETVYGGKVTLGYKCRSCGYWTGMKRRVPTRYIFYGDGAKYPVPDESVRPLDQMPSQK